MWAVLLRSMSRHTSKVSGASWDLKMLSTKARQVFQWNHRGLFSFLNPVLPLILYELLSKQIKHQSELNSERKLIQAQVGTRLLTRARIDWIEFGVVLECCTLSVEVTDGRTASCINIEYIGFPFESRRIPGAFVTPASGACDTILWLSRLYSIFDNTTDSDNLYE